MTLGHYSSSYVPSSAEITRLVRAMVAVSDLEEAVWIE